MTREERKKYYTTIEGLRDAMYLPNIIDQIYDDIESRVCENCKYYDDEENLSKNNHMECKLFFIETQAISNVRSFGCSYFERKLESR